MLTSLELDLVEKLILSGQSPEQKRDSARQILDALSVEELEAYGTKINQYQNQLLNHDDTYWFSLRSKKAYAK